MFSRDSKTYRESERGSALIMALLVVIALTGLGLVGLKHTTFELRQASNAKLAKQAMYTADAGMMAAMETVGSNSSAFQDHFRRVESRFREDGRSLPTTFGDFKTAEGDFLTNGHLFGTAQGSFEEEQNTVANVEVVLTDPVSTQSDQPGFSVEFCQLRYTFRSTGTVGEVQTNLRWNDPVRSASSRTIGHSKLQPQPCQ